MNRVLICGSRAFTDYDLFCEKTDKILSEIDGDIVIVSGMACGADSLAVQYAKERGYALDENPADWVGHGKYAGFLRNQVMVEKATHVIAFWDFTSRGTKNTIGLARQYGRPLRVIKVSTNTKAQPH